MGHIEFFCETYFISMLIMKFFQAVSWVWWPGRQPERTSL